MVSTAHHLRRRSLLAAIGLPLAGCFAQDEDCQPFNHPAYQQWWLGPVGTVVRFVNEAGRVYTLTVEKIEIREQDADEGSSCDRSAIHSLRGGDGHLFLMTFDQEIRSTAPLDQQRLLMILVAGLLVSGANAYFVVNPVSDPLNVRVLNTGEVLTYSPTRTIRGVTYTDVLEVTTPPGHPGRSPQAGKFDNTWVRVAVARGVGLLQYELADGQVFTRVP
jgi:hypothetical protein